MRVLLFGDTGQTNVALQDLTSFFAQNRKKYSEYRLGGVWRVKSITLKPRKSQMRYSPRPIEEYSRTIKGTVCGPETSVFLKDDVEAWNLAFLSYDYAKRPTHADAKFSSHITYSMRTSLATGELDLVGRLPQTMTIRSLLMMPAPQFVKVLNHRNLYQQLPMFKQYGKAWLDLIEKRSWLCSTYVEGGGDQFEDLHSTDQAAEILRKIAYRKL